MRPFLIAGIASIVLSTGVLAEDDPDFALLPDGTAQEDVFYMCSACHSVKLVAQQRLSRKRWDETLDWMVEEGGMAELDAEEREPILDYLETHFGEETPR